MNRENFFKRIIEKCRFEECENIKEETRLELLEDWDSLALITVISVFKSAFDEIPEIEKIKSCETFKDMLDLANENYKE